MEKQPYILREALKVRIRQFITKIQSPKLIFAHHDLLNLFNFAYQFKLNELLGDKDRLFEFEEDDQATDDSNAINLVFLLHPVPTAMRTIQSMIVRNQAKFVTKKQYSLCFTPKVDVICMQELERLNIKNKIQISNFDFGLIPFPNNLISLELSHHLNEVDYINSCVQALLLLSKLIGKTKRVVGKGDKAQMILKQFEKVVITQQLLTTDPQRQDTFLIVIDRRIDLVTPLLTAHSYEGLIDHFYGIDLTRIKVPQKLLGKDGQTFETYRLYNRDKIYDEIAHMDVIQNLTHLQNARQKIKAEVNFRKQIATNAKQYEEVTSVWGVKYEQANNHLSIINSIINAMSQHLHFRNLINIQMDILEKGKTNIEDLHYLSLNYPAEHLLRLICLYSQIYPLPSFYSRFEKDLLQLMVGNYSNEHIISFYNLQKLGWLKNSKIKNKWEQICQAYSLLPTQNHSYTKVFIKYSALSVRFIEMLIKGQLSPEANALLGRENNYLKGLQKECKPIKQLYLFYIGGITYGQISCLRLLQRELGIKIFILTTNVSSGYTMIKTSLETMKF